LSASATVTTTVTPDEGRTKLVLTQDKNPTEEAREHSEENWRMMFAGLKKVLEK